MLAIYWTGFVASDGMMNVHSPIYQLMATNALLFLWQTERTHCLHVNTVKQIAVIPSLCDILHGVPQLECVPACDCYSVEWYCGNYDEGYQKLKHFCLFSIRGKNMNITSMKLRKYKNGRKVYSLSLYKSTICESPTAKSSFVQSSFSISMICQLFQRRIPTSHQPWIFVSSHY